MDCVEIAIGLGMLVSNPREVHQWIASRIAKDVEEIWVLALNASCQLIQGKMIYRGTVDRCISHPRDIFRFVITQNACSFILVHNHPSGSLEPSKEDLEITSQLILVSKLVEIPMADHVIVTEKSYVSLKQTNGILFT